MRHAQIGLIGLGAMGQSLARNIASKGFSIVVNNRTQAVTNEFIDQYGSDMIIGSDSIEEFVHKLERPRKILLLIKAGDPVDEVITGLLPHLEEGDLIVDCGNSLFKDTIRRTKELSEQGILFMGSGVSGGEEGALHGPSIMPGGTTEAWKLIQPVFEKIAAKDFSGGPCVAHIGNDGAGHYVKMVHNGIEYAVMQAIAEVYFMMRQLYGKQPDAIASVFEQYNTGPLESYLIEITTKVLSRKDERTDGFLIDYILDKAKQKGTGAWTAIDAMEQGITLTTIAEAVFSRTISAQKAFREELSGSFVAPTQTDLPDFDAFTGLAEQALLNTMYVSYAQGYHLITSAAETYDWEINLAEVSRIWQGGCIIRARLLETLQEAFEKNESQSLLQIHMLHQRVAENVEAQRELAALAITNALHTPVLVAALQYLDGISTAQSSANLIQGLRDFFGAHTYENQEISISAV